MFTKIHEKYVIFYSAVPTMNDFFWLLLFAHLKFALYTFYSYLWIIRNWIIPTELPQHIKYRIYSHWIKIFSHYIVNKQTLINPSTTYVTNCHNVCNSIQSQLQSCSQKYSLQLGVVFFAPRPKKFPTYSW